MVNVSSILGEADSRANGTYLVNGVALYIWVQLLQQSTAFKSSVLAQAALFQKEVYTKVFVSHGSGIDDCEIARSWKDKVLEGLNTNSVGRYQKDVGFL